MLSEFSEVSEKNLLQACEIGRNYSNTSVSNSLLCLLDVEDWEMPFEGSYVFTMSL
jgi:hypothetical protein